MPLEAGSSKAVISHNIEEMQASGHSHEVSVAAALHNADKEHHERKMARESHEYTKYGRPTPY